MSCYRPAFNLLEIILSVALVLILAGISLPIGNYFYKKNCLDSSISQLKSAVILTKNKARAQENDSSWGIYANGKQFTIFQGDDYLTRDPSSDYIEDFYCGVQVSIKPDPVIVFNKRTALPARDGCFYFTNSGLAAYLSIDNYGVINQQTTY